MKKMSLILLFSILFNALVTPVGFAVNTALDPENAGEPFTGLIISWDQYGHTTQDELRVRVREKASGKWTGWYLVRGDEDIDEHEVDETRVTNAQGAEAQGAEARGEWTPQETLFNTNLSTDFEYRIERDESTVSGKNTDAQIKNLHVEKILSDREGQPRLVAALDLPRKSKIISRSEWGANEEITFHGSQVDLSGEQESGDGETADKSDIETNDPEIKSTVTHDSNGREYIWPLQYANKIKFIVIHHTASVSNLDNPKTAIQNIEYYHAAKRGWGDIGYNYIIDTGGGIYEGRKGGEGVVAGHAKSLNKVSIGIAVLGDYEAGELPSPVLQSLAGLIAEKARSYRINPAGKRSYNNKLYNTIQGHSENTATLCPGAFLKNKLEAIRRLVAYNNSGKKAANPAKYDFSDFQRQDLITMDPGEEKEIIIRLKNKGEIDWGSRTFLEKNDDENDSLPKIIARLESPKVEPGNIGVFKGTLPSMLESGLRVPELNLVINGSIRPGKSFPLAVMVSAPQAGYEIVGRKDPPNIMKAGQRVRAWIKLKNTGNFTWERTGENPIRIGTLKPKDGGNPFFQGDNRIARLVEKKVPPGEVGTFAFNLRAPKYAATYTEYFAPVIENVMWLEDKGMHFTIEVTTDEKPLRVLLGIKGKKPVIRGENGMKLFDGKNVVREFSGNENVTAARLESGKYVARTATQRFVLDSPPRFQANSNGILEVVNFENRPSWNTSLNDNLFRGVLEIQKIDDSLRVINELPVEDYLRGVAEVSNDNPMEKIKTIIILARSYAKYYRDIGKKFPGKPYHLDDDPDSTQKYVGYGLEMRSPNIVMATRETAGQIVLFNGEPVITPYFSQSDGRTRSAQEVWGWTFAPYLQSVPDGFCTAGVLKGHGVGLSGCGAGELARQGKTAEEIIKYYYTGVELTD